MKAITSVIMSGACAIMLAGCATQEPVQYNQQSKNCTLLGKSPTQAELRTMFNEHKVPIVLVDNEYPYFCGCAVRNYGGALEVRNVSGEREVRHVEGTTEFRMVGGAGEVRKMGGVEETRKVDGQVEMRKIEGSEQNLTCQLVSSCSLYKLSEKSKNMQLFDGTSLLPIKSDGCVNAGG